MRDSQQLEAGITQEGQPLIKLIDRENTRIAKRKRIRRISFILIPVVVAALWFFVLAPKPVPMAMRFRIGTASVGEIIRQVRATGNVEAVTEVQVGAEVSGRIANVAVDFNDKVKKGQVLASFDRTLLSAEYKQAEAAAAAAANTLQQAKTNRNKVALDFARSKKLFEQRLLAQADFDNAEALMRSADEAVTGAEAQLAASRAAAEVERTNLNHGVIYSPIDGIIITRNIDSGQTLASVFQTPVLFTVAADLRKMQVIAAVDEADIGELKAGQKATFTVNAYPDRIFEGIVTQVRNSPVIVQDVVTYGTVITVDNTDFALKPGMTATVRILTASVSNVRRVSASAFRFTPPGEKAGSTPAVWKFRNDSLHRFEVLPGISDGENTEIISGDIKTGDQILEELTPDGKKAYGITK